MNTYIIINKEKTLTEKLENILNEFSTFCNVGLVSDEREAMNLILKNKPDLVFLNMDNLIDDTFGFVKELNIYLNIVPDFVAISKTKDHAYQALKHNFIDYLLHPISELDLRKILMRFKKKKSQQQHKTLCLKSYKDYQYFNTKDILFLKADNNNTDFHIKDGSVVSAYKTLKTFENTLPSNFLRIHKSYIVNKDYVSRINYGKLKCYLEYVTEKLPFTKTYINNIEFINKSLTDISLVN